MKLVEIIPAALQLIYIAFHTFLRSNISTSELHQTIKNPLKIDVNHVTGVPHERRVLALQ